MSETYTFGGRTYRYEPIHKEQVPSGVRFDVPPQFQGQATERAFGGFGGGGMDVGDPYLRVRSGGYTEFFRRAD